MEDLNLRLDEGGTFHVAKVNDTLIKWIIKVCPSRATLKELRDIRMHEEQCHVPNKHRSKFVPCENPECETRLVLGDEVLIVDIKPDNRRVFCSGSCCRQYGAAGKVLMNAEFRKRSDYNKVTSD